LTVVDAGVVISFLAGEATAQVEALATLLSDAEAILAPSTVTELLYDPKAGSDLAPLIDNLQTLEIGEGYWARAGKLRANVRRAGRKAALGDALLAQACFDADLPLLTANADFRAFVQCSNLRLAPTS
jgi:predicted nucleic acid-binding protein